MALPPASTQNSLQHSLRTVQSYADVAKDRASAASAVMAAGPVSSTFVFNLLDQLRDLIGALNAVKNTAGLNSYATSEVPTYTGVMVTDINATVSAAQACIDWVVANFPVSGGWLLAEQLNADGSRTDRTFSSAATSGLRTALNNLVATIA